MEESQLNKSRTTNRRDNNFIGYLFFSIVTNSIQFQQHTLFTCANKKKRLLDIILQLIVNYSIIITIKMNNNNNNNEKKKCSIRNY